MLFSNKKEDVIDLKLTTHGRRLLSDGVFKPIFKKESKRKHHILRYNITFLVERSEVKTRDKQQKERKTIF